MDPRMQAWLNVKSQDPNDMQNIMSVYSQLQQQNAPQPDAQPDLDPEFLKQLAEKIRQWEQQQGMSGAGSQGIGSNQLGDLASELNDY